MSHVSLANLSVLTNLETTKIKEGLKFSTFRVIPPESQGVPILQGRTKSGEVLYFFPGRLLSPSRTPAAPLVAQGSIIDAWIQIRSADPEQRENLRLQIEERISAMNAATMSGGAARVWARLAKLRDESLAATYKELCTKQNLTEEAALIEAAARACITATMARRIITRITKSPVPNPKIKSANVRKQREDAPDYMTRLHTKAKKAALDKKNPQLEYVKKQKQIAYIRAHQKGIKAKLRMEDLLVLKGGAVGVDGSGVDGVGVDGSGVDGSGVDGSGVDGVVYGFPTHCPVLNIPLDYTESKPAKANMARVWRLKKEADLFDGDDGSAAAGFDFNLVPPNVAIVSHLHMTLLDNNILNPETKAKLLAALKDDIQLNTKKMT